MAPTQPFSSPHVHPSYPSLYLYPLNDTFIPKHISLHNDQRVTIGRDTKKTKTIIPGERNGYFDSKVVSRQHAEIWEDSGKIYIKDVKSSNGTFINGERLSSEGVESEPFELENHDIVQFGIDIIGEDNKTTICHKVEARVTCVFTNEDAHFAALSCWLEGELQKTRQTGTVADSSALSLTNNQPAISLVMA
ncbi:SMAD/FHA domain-containing protein [Suillus discolor]|uniref:SMAD/FHA domain-containing protein n=1 Tax=Suillus discolor TaxID=1912936 RepID=A0A9P7EYA1_9AGAM|nr:SMAD/FHA domain-containing protein [Suillus discolor]KAG2095089.1 SMAD/FHA domain-containing protein [Suillus discolor]